MMSASDRRPNVRVIPIEVRDEKPVRHRALSGPVGIKKDLDEGPALQKDDSSLKRSIEDLSKPNKIKPGSGPKIFNIPIQVEGSNDLLKRRDVNKGPKFENSTKLNGCSVSKPVKVPSANVRQIPVNIEQSRNVNKQQSVTELTLKKISDVLENLKIYDSGVNEFNGTVKDKQYRYLDEMLTQCMLKLDDIDTMGIDELRLARKNAVKKVQANIDMLESKVNGTLSTSIMQTEDKCSEIESVAGGLENETEAKVDVEMEEQPQVQEKTFGTAVEKVLDEQSGISDSLKVASGDIAETDVEMQDKNELKLAATKVTLAPESNLHLETLAPEKIHDIETEEQKQNEMTESGQSESINATNIEMCDVQTNLDSAIKTTDETCTLSEEQKTDYSVTNNCGTSDSVNVDKKN